MQDLLENCMLRSILKPLLLSDLIAQTLITPLGMLPHEELEELDVLWTSNYLPYYTNGVFTTTISATTKQLFLYQTIGPEDLDENLNTPYPWKETPSSFQIPTIWGNTQNMT